MTSETKSWKAYWKLFRTALKGGEHEYTSGSINRAIFLLAIPMIAEMLMESLFAVVDVFFVSKVSVNAVATVGLTESVLFIIYSIAVGLSMAVTAIVPRRVGAKEPKRASDAAFQAIIIAVGIGLVLGLTGFAFAGDILQLMGGEDDLIEEGIAYAEIMYAGNISIILLFMINAIFRGAGDPAIAMRSLWLANGINIILDPMLIFGIGFFPELGVAGAAVATTTGRSIGVIYQCWHLFNGSSLIRLGWENIVIRWKTIRELFEISFGGIAQFLIESASWIFLVRIVSMFGSEALAGYTIAFESSYSPCFRVGVWLMLLRRWSDKTLGEKARSGGNFSLADGIVQYPIPVVCIHRVLHLLIKHIGHIHGSASSPRDRNGSIEDHLYGLHLLSYGMVIGQAFNGAGDTRTPMWVSLIAFWLVQIPLSYLLAVTFDWKSDGVFICISFAHALYAIIAIVLFRRGKWKLKEVD